MKIRIIAVLLLCLLLVGCADKVTPTGTFGTFLPDATDEHGHPVQTRPNRPTPTTQPTVPDLGPAAFTMYLPNESADGFIESGVNMNQLYHEGILLLLQVKGVVTEGVAAKSCKKDGTQLHLDMNQAFLDLLMTKDAAGEKMLIGSVVNTFLSAYQCESVLLTVNGAAFSSATTTYNAPLTFIQ